MSNGKAALDMMHRRYGVAQGRTCEDCVKLMQTGSRPHPRGMGSLRELGCRVYMKEFAKRARWAASWTACGLMRQG